MDPENRQKIFKELTARMKKASGRPSLPPPPPPRRQKSLGSFPNSPNVSSLHSTTLFDYISQFLPHFALSNCLVLSTNLFQMSNQNIKLRKNNSQVFHELFIHCTFTNCLTNFILFSSLCKIHKQWILSRCCIKK